MSGARAAWRVGVAALALCGPGPGLRSAGATTFAPPQIIQCPGSDEVRQVWSLNSGNTLGAVFWSDGFRIAPGLPDFPQITRCAPGAPMFWVASARVLGHLQAGLHGEDPTWVAAPVVRALAGEEFLEALAAGLGDTPQRERYLRLRAWWSANAGFRQVGTPAATPGMSDFPSGSPARANLEALAPLLDEDQLPDRLLKAELMRQLARFDEAQALLPTEPPQDAGARARWSLIRERLAARDARVARFAAPR